MEMPWGQRVNVSCRGRQDDGDRLRPVAARRPRHLRRTTVTLPQVEAASDAKFTDGRYTLYINDSRAALEETGVVRRGPCTPR